ncbi:velvet factor-domain-containing protein [Polychytrium aggregatum]|uniref:velvet factor-domain-containing protein n=1 Tax=Polychytrium aggregatum TaxID=110093 RepID=UPI0022FDD755|nr:velvet factor-domain-containing protein [Polychytrium aggregatum]KAI9206948.1 velvet factor-domain-containing protein [Polychytrium aggregatum]
MFLHTPASRGGAQSGRKHNDNESPVVRNGRHGKRRPGCPSPYNHTGLCAAGQPALWPVPMSSAPHFPAALVPPLQSNQVAHVANGSHQENRAVSALSALTRNLTLLRPRLLVRILEPRRRLHPFFLSILGAHGTMSMAAVKTEALPDSTGGSHAERFLVQPADYYTIHLSTHSQPSTIRCCGFGTRTKKRSIDPPPVVQLSLLQPDGAVVTKYSSGREAIVPLSVELRRRLLLRAPESSTPLCSAGTAIVTPKRTDEPDKASRPSWPRDRLTFGWTRREGKEAPTIWQMDGRISRELARWASNFTVIVELWSTDEQSSLTHVLRGTTTHSGSAAGPRPSPTHSFVSAPSYPPYPGPSGLPSGLPGHAPKQSSPPTDQPEVIPTIFGGLVAHSEFLISPEGEHVVLFIFPSIAVRVQGTYRLRFQLFNLADAVRGLRSEALASVFSDTFISYSWKKYPGISGPTPFTAHLSRQGALISTRTPTSSTAHVAASSADAAPGPDHDSDEDEEEDT